MKALLLFLFSTSLFAKTLYINVPWWTGEKVFITGASSELCQWKANCIQLEKAGPSSFRFEIPESLENQSFEFKITRGSWKSEAATSLSKPLDNFRFNPRKVKTYVSINNWSDEKPLRAKRSIKTFKLFSPELKRDKTIRVLLPPSYQDGNKTYPVIYMHDGQNLFDATVGNFAMEWSVDETLEKLYAEKKIPEVIIVGIDSNEDRTAEYNWYMKGHLYGTFLAKTLKKYVDNNFRTKKSREYNFLMGSSYGAMISFTTLWKYSNVFSKASCVSLPAHPKKRYLFNFIDKEKLANSKVYFYVDHGLIKGDSGYYKHTSLFIEKLRKKGFGRDRLNYQLFPLAEHREVDWARRLPYMLTDLMN